MRREGESIAGISRATGASEPTVRKRLKPQDLSPKMPARAKGPSVVDGCSAIVDSWLEADRGAWHKQRHTAQRVWERLVEEEHATMSHSTVRRYVKDRKGARKSEGDGFLDHAGIPADMQVDFGQADFYVVGVRTRLHHLVCDFPFSNMGLAQVFPGENAECVCEGLMAVFSYIGGVPRRVIFDNSTGVGRKICGVIRTSRLFASLAARFGFECVFCNADAGHEKGAVGNKVGRLRRRLLVPLPHFDNVRSHNARLLDRCTELSDKGRYVKGEPESQLFMEDRFALLPLPDAPFEAVTWQRMKADKYGNVVLGGRHRCSSAPGLGGCELIVGKCAFDAEVCDSSGTHVATHPRAYGDRPTESVEPASQLPLLCRKPNGWPNSRVRASLPGGLREWADRLEPEPRKEFLRVLRDVTAQSGHAPAVEAAARIVELGDEPDRASVTVFAAGICNGRGIVDYGEAVDTSDYDAAFAPVGGGRQDDWGREGRRGGCRQGGCAEALHLQPPSAGSWDRPPRASSTPPPACCPTR